MEEEYNSRVNHRKRNKQEAKAYKKLYIFPWDEIPTWVIVCTIVGLLVFSFLF